MERDPLAPIVPGNNGAESKRDYKLAQFIGACVKEVNMSSTMRKMDMTGCLSIQACRLYLEKVLPKIYRDPKYKVQADKFHLSEKEWKRIVLNYVVKGLYPVIDIGKFDINKDKWHST